MKKTEYIVLIGYGGHGKSIADSIIQLGNYTIIGYTDIEKRNGQLQYLGKDTELQKIFKKGVTKAALGLGFLGKDVLKRKELFEYAKKIGFTFPPIIDKSAIIALDSTILEGTFVGKCAIINSNTRIGECSIINTGAIVEHDCEIGSFTHLATGSKVCGNTTIGDYTFVGAGTTIIQGIKVGNDSIIGAGSVVINNVDDNEKKYGLIK